jgi:signal peptidase II
VNNGRLPDIAGLSTFFDCETLTMANYAPRSLFVWLGIALVILVADQITKLMVIDSFQLGDSQTVTSYFNLVRVHNSGAAFSFLSTASGWQRWFFTGIGLVAAVYIVWMLRSHPDQTLFCFALSLVLGGAVGNVIDRLLWGHVVDFLDFHWAWLSPVFYQGHFPAFNVADSAISVGVVCLIADELIRVRRSRT